MDEKKYSEEEHIKKFVEQQEGNKSSNEKQSSLLSDTSDVPKPWLKTKEHVSLANQIGWQEIDLGDLPTQGLFYPEGTEIVIRAAESKEIRHWSTIDENDLAKLDDMLNFVLERCVKIKFPEGQRSTWMDLKEVDRFYLILAVSEYTFIKSGNKLKVKISETKSMDVTKEMVDYINLDQELMEYYDPKLRLFSIKLPDDSELRVTLPSVGVTNWLKKYVIRQKRNNEQIDEDFVNFAPLVILDWRGLTELTYKNFVMESEEWSALRISLLSEIRQKLIESVEPVIKFTDENGGERRLPLNFQGGIKSLFIISNPFGQLGRN